MRRRCASFVLLIAAICPLIAGVAVHAQTAPRGRGRGAGQTPDARAAASITRRRNPANVAQLMRGVLFPNANIIFAAQNGDFLKMKSDADPSLSTNPLTGTYAGWQAVENAGLALVEVAALLTNPRLCSNGTDAPVRSEDWVKYLQGLRTAGFEAYNAARAKRIDAFADVADHLATACANCHDVYREKSAQQGGLGARCTK